LMPVDPQGAEERRQEKIRDRRVETRPTDDGMAMLTIHHTAERIATAHSLIQARARELKAMGGDTRTLSEIEADVACDLVLGVNCGGRTVEVHLTLPATTALGVDNQPGEVDGLPLTAPAARELAKEASSWRWLHTDPKTGQVVDMTSARYTPPESLATYVKVRDRTCRYPGCTRRARHCDVDHRVPWPQGTTCDTNCQCLCRRHHKAKHEAGWTVEEIKPGWLQWTSPLGFTHLIPPEPPPPAPRVVSMVDDPPPF
jgi:hypothetical protein